MFISYEYRYQMPKVSNIWNLYRPILVRSLTMRVALHITRSVHIRNCCMQHFQRTMMKTFLWTELPLKLTLNCWKWCLNFKASVKKINGDNILLFYNWILLSPIFVFKFSALRGFGFHDVIRLIPDNSGNRMTS